MLNYCEPTCHITLKSISITGLFYLVELPQTIYAETLYEQALEHNIAIAPGILFSSDKRFSHHIRLNCSYACDERIEQAIQTLGQLIHTMEINR